MARSTPLRATMLPPPTQEKDTEITKESVEARLNSLLNQGAVTQLLVMQLIQHTGTGPRISAELQILSDVLGAHGAVNINRTTRTLLEKLVGVGADIRRLENAVDNAKKMIDLGDLFGGKR